MPWMTYAEAATALRIAPDSVRQRARRGRWARRLGNDGLACVEVPDALLSAPTSPATTPTTPGPTPIHLMRQRIVELETELAARPARDTILQMEARIADLSADRDAWRVLAQRPWWRRLVG